MTFAKRICLVGVGLIGGSWARALRAAGAVEEIVGCGRSVENLERAVALGVIDRYEHDPALAVRDADVVVLGVPLGSMRSVLERMLPGLREDAVITDVGSAKVSVVADAEAVFGDLPARFVPGHPIAGTERSGVEASFAELFQDRLVILTPSERTDPEALSRVTRLWEAAGAEVTHMTVEHHDEVLAATSHLPHVLAYALVESLSRWDERHEIFRYAAGGFRDFTRIASSDPAMWRDICVANRDAVASALRRYLADLTAVCEQIEAGDGARLFELFGDAKRARDRFVQK